MNYQTFEPHTDLKSIVKYYWTLEVSADYTPKRQQIIPDGCIEMAFNIGDDIKRIVSENEFIIHPCAMVLGQRTKSFDIEPTGYVNSFAICFFPYGFANFIDTPIKSLTDKETPIEFLFGKSTADNLEQKMRQATDTKERIEVIENFLLSKLNEQRTIENIVKSTIETLIETNGNTSIKGMLNNDLAKRRQLERTFSKQIGLSPKQLGKVIRLQAALNLLLNQEEDNLTHIAYESGYYDQAHFIRDFKEFIGTNPNVFLKNEKMALSTLFYS
ncbi:AraC family transcriptional regulator [Pseudopedobacter beijingensis]|uniref:DUF6597 domain-containing transcriptional factor n=1 Tax=Pseudopedobacter beijingensis TaxID=1207056 RepID=A0ABW4ICB8_9SPHI